MKSTNKYFLITIDTEGDNLWEYHKGDNVQSRNALYVPRFQELCERYGFKSVWLTNYEMIMSNDFVQYIRPKVEQGFCEVGIHVHAWNNPPLYDLNGLYSGNPYLIEYPYEVMREKFKTTYDLITSKIGVAPVSHRAGRWAMNEDYFKLLKEFDIKVDCSHTPGESWCHCAGETVAGGSDYTAVSKNATMIDGILEVPVSIRTMRCFYGRSKKQMLKNLFAGKQIWLRPTGSSLKEMKKLCKSISREEDTDYLEFMIHSSEFMPGGSPYFENQASVDRLFDTMDALFKYVKKNNFKGITLYEYIKANY